LTKSEHVDVINAS